MPKDWSHLVGVIGATSQVPRAICEPREELPDGVLRSDVAVKVAHDVTLPPLGVVGQASKARARYLTPRKHGHSAGPDVASAIHVPEANVTKATYPTPNQKHRQADAVTHAIALVLILVAGGLLVTKSIPSLEPKLVLAVIVYLLCALASNLASTAYHFSTWHHRRILLRRIDHAAIYPSISGAFTPFFVIAGTPWTMTLLWICWGLTALAVWNKITNETVKSRWSTASYLGLGALGLSALPDLSDVPVATLWCIVAGAVAYVVGTAFYAQKEMPYRYAVWHTWVNIGGALMFAGIWIALPAT
jgi:hemolysin III